MKTSNAPHAACLALFLLASPQAIAGEPVTIALGEPEPLPQQLHAFNSNLLTATAFHGISYSSEEIRKAIADLRPGGLRFPGGTTANNYLWREDSFSLQSDDRTEWAGQQLELFRKIGRKYDLPGYAKLCRDFDLTPIYVLNVYEETAEDIPALFARFDELGLDVQAIEMGNEPYWDPRSLLNVWKYSEYCHPLAEAIRKHRPEVKIGACFGPLREGSTYPEKWNAPLARQNWYDAVVYHEYYGGQGFALEEGVELPLEAVLHPEALFDEPVAAFSKLLPGKPIWITEWNIGQKGLGQWKNTGAELLFLGAALTRILEHRDHFDWSCFHQIYEGRFGTFFYDKESGIQTLPSYELFRLVRGMWSGAEAYRPLSPDTPDDLRGFATEDDEGLRLFLVNRGPEARAVALPEGFAPDVAALTIAADPRKLLPVSTAIADPLPVAEGILSLPPWSVSLVGSPGVIESATRTEIVESGNLFPARPHLTLWYPPYARKQPRVAPDGSYTVDLSALADKKTVMIKMNLSGLDLESEARYAVAFSASATEGVGLVARVPGQGKAEGDWIQLMPQPGKVRLDFAYDPAVNGGEVSFLFSDTALAKGGQVILRDFRIARLSGAGSPPASAGAQ